MKRAPALRRENAVTTTERVKGGNADAAVQRNPSSAVASSPEHVIAKRIGISAGD
jgi:hypothetical protein